LKGLWSTVFLILCSCGAYKGKGNAYPEVINYSPTDKNITCQYTCYTSFSLECKDQETPQERLKYRAYVDGVLQKEETEIEGAFTFEYIFSNIGWTYEVKLSCTDEPVGEYPARTVERVWYVTPEQIITP